MTWKERTLAKVGARLRGVRGIGELFYSCCCFAAGWGISRLMSRACQGSMGRAVFLSEEPLIVFLNKDVTSLNCLLESVSC